MHTYDVEAGDGDHFGLDELAEESDDEMGSGYKRTSFDGAINGSSAPNGGLNGVPNGHHTPTRRTNIEFESVKPNKGPDGRR